MVWFREKSVPSRNDEMIFWLLCGKDLVTVPETLIEHTPFP
jgi:hypothetical protein